MRIVDIQRFCTHDGPGVRTTVFCKGCPLRCAWCHNPETQKYTAQVMLHKTLCAGCGACIRVCPAGAQILTQNDRRRDISLCIGCGACAKACPTEACRQVSRDMEPAEVAKAVLADAVFYGESGGVTLSGGEPLCAEGVIELLHLLKEQDLHVVVETCGACDANVLRCAVPYVDEFFWDVKHTDPQQHKELTGAALSPILENLALADALGAKIRLRCLLVGGLNTDDAHFERVADLYHSLQHCTGVQLLRYHPMGGSKAEALGLADNGRREWIPTDMQVVRAEHVLRQRGVLVIVEQT